jgi:hypothetical protein
MWDLLNKPRLQMSALDELKLGACVVAGFVVVVGLILAVAWAWDEYRDRRKRRRERAAERALAKSLAAMAGPAIVPPGQVYRRWEMGNGHGWWKTERVVRSPDPVPQPVRGVVDGITFVWKIEGANTYQETP